MLRTALNGSQAPLKQYYDAPSGPTLTELLRPIDSTKDKITQGYKQINSNLTQTIQDKLRFLWTYHSNAIEGNKLTLGDTIFFLQEGLTVGGKRLKDFLDTTNHAEAIDYLEEVINNNTPINCHLLRSMNALLLKGVDTIPAVDMQGKSFQKKLKSGEYKTDPNYVVQPDGSIHEYVEPHLVEEQLTHLCEWANNSNDHPIVIAAIAHYNMVRIHPFQDGNGRGARLLMNLVLIQAGYVPAIIEVEKREAYLRTLKEADAGNLGPLALLVADAIQKTQATVLSKIEQYLTKNK
jgi:Fic family protein